MADEFAYIASKVRHMQRFGIPADYNKRTGAAQPMWRAELVEKERARQARAVMAGRAAPGFLDFSKVERESMLDAAKRRREREAE